MKVRVTPLRVHLYIGNSDTWQPELVKALGYWKSLELRGTGFELHSIADEAPSRRRCTNGVNQMHHMKLLHARQRQSGLLALAMHKPPPHQCYNCREEVGKGARYGCLVATPVDWLGTPRCFSCLQTNPWPPGTPWCSFCPCRLGTLRCFSCLQTNPWPLGTPRCSSCLHKNPWPPGTPRCSFCPCRLGTPRCFSCLHKNPWPLGTPRCSFCPCRLGVPRCFSCLVTNPWPLGTPRCSFCLKTNPWPLGTQERSNLPLLPLGSQVRRAFAIASLAWRATAHVADGS